MTKNPIMHTMSIKQVTAGDKVIRSEKRTPVA